VVFNRPYLMARPRGAEGVYFLRVGRLQLAPDLPIAGPAIRPLQIGLSNHQRRAHLRGAFTGEFAAGTLPAAM